MVIGVEGLAWPFWSSDWIQSEQRTSRNNLSYMMTHPARGRLVNGNLCVPVSVSKYVPIPAQGRGQSTRAAGVEA